jgi:hypothetical protein
MEPLFSGLEANYPSWIRSQGDGSMAHREQRGNKEKKKPKQDKNGKDKAAPPPFVQPELVRKPHKGKPA